MSDDPLDIDIDDLQRRMDGAMVSLKTEFASLRTGRASGSILDPVMVDAYGQCLGQNTSGQSRKSHQGERSGNQPANQWHDHHVADPGAQ